MVFQPSGGWVQLRTRRQRRDDGDDPTKPLQFLWPARADRISGTRQAGQGHQDTRTMHYVAVK